MGVGDLAQYPTCSWLEPWGQLRLPRKYVNTEKSIWMRQELW